MEEKEKNKNKNEPTKLSDELDIESLLHKSTQELNDLAKNLLNGKYQKNSWQRDKIMQLLVKQLSSQEKEK